MVYLLIFLSLVIYIKNIYFIPQIDNFKYDFPNNACTYILNLNQVDLYLHKSKYMSEIIQLKKNNNHYFF